MDTRSCILITGAATGIGRATARLFAQRGWFVGLADIDQAALLTLSQELGAQSATPLHLDVTSSDDWHLALKKFHSLCGRLDVLVNNAGILISGPFESNALSRHHALVDVNLKGMLNGCFHAKPYLSSTPRARVINLSSTAAVYGQASLATYSSTKFAVRGLTEGLNVEWQKDDIRVMDIMPLYVRTGMVKDLNARSADRLGVRLTAEDVARVIWKAADFKGSYGKVHWPVGLQAIWLYRLTSLTPDWLARFIARRIAS
ncbi:MAG: SDR family oxidoreductase [Rhodoferax sp.]|uniref:SDR family oxidoreductase n=1 Tax=Rhodoferax sp. TaxID=50421 RepID=UPI00272479C9|nr:SDR family oxidoreductase [Rhodoferax sp.]MDO8448625.1 SDR family oxidoreductase [Rhodoferax sp.]